MSDNQQPEQAAPVAAVEPVAPAPMPMQPQYQMQQPVAAVPHHGSGMAVASLVLGIVSLVLCWIWVVGIPVGILAIVFGVLSKKQPANKGMAMAGLVTGIIGVVLAIVIIVIALTTVNKAANDLEDAIDRINKSSKGSTLKTR